MDFTFAAVNKDSLALMGKFAAYMLGLLFLVMLIAYGTPFLAKKIDALREKHKKPERKKKSIGLYDINTDDGLPDPYGAKSNLKEQIPQKDDVLEKAMEAEIAPVDERTSPKTDSEE